MLKRRTISALSVFALLCLCAGQAHAANPDRIAIVSWVGDQLNQAVDRHIDVFLNEGQTVLNSLFALLLVWYLMIGLLSRQIRNELLVELIFNFMLCSMMLTFYDAPMPWGGGISFHQLFAKEAQWAAATLDLAVVDDVVNATVAMWKGMEGPHAWDVVGVLTYPIIMFMLIVIWLLCSGITLIAHIALGVGALFGPLCIPFFIWPVMSWLFWGWVRFMTISALYIVASSAIVLIYANVILFFFNHEIKGDYSAANQAALLMPFVVLNGVFVIAFWQCHGWARDIASGTSSIGANVSGMVQAASIALLA